MVTSLWFDVAPFDGKNNFAIWRIKMKALLRREGTVRALNGKYPNDMTSAEIEEMEEVQLSLKDEVLREVSDVYLSMLDDRQRCSVVRSIGIRPLGASVFSLQLLGARWQSDGRRVAFGCYVGVFQMAYLVWVAHGSDLCDARG
uniref:DUF4219 domain-containing protein n=1 Tax=Kalanchoe fedtschenkoi TaxID=63787 RepID=A0A7N0UJH4_KALFE